MSHPGRNPAGADGGASERQPGAKFASELSGQRHGERAGAEQPAGIDAIEEIVEAPERDAEGVPELHEVDCPTDLREEIEAALARYPEPRSASIPALWAVQRRYGWCTPEGIRQAAAVMRITPAHLEGVASFYDMFRLEPSGRHTVMVCTNLSCWMAGSDELLDAFCEAAGADHDEARHEGATSADGEFFVTSFQCLGGCDLAPMASIDSRYVGPLDPDDARTAVDQVLSGEEVLPGKWLMRRPAAGGPEPEPDPRVLEGERGKGGNRQMADAGASERESTANPLEPDAGASEREKR